MARPDGTEVELTDSFKFDAEPWHFEYEPLGKIFNPPHEKLNKEAKRLGYYPDSPYSGVCWLLEEVLGLDAKTVAMDDFNFMEDTYRTFMFTPEGKKRYFDNGDVALLDVAWTPEQKRLIREWWEYIPPELRG